MYFNYASLNLPFNLSVNLPVFISATEALEHIQDKVYAEVVTV